MLIVMAGLPGSGKSAIAGELATALRCALLSVDPIEAAMWRAGVAPDQPTGLAAYVVAEDLPREQLLLGNVAVVDAVDEVEEAREQWRSLAADLTAPLAFIEVFCSDPATHRQRLEHRRRGIAGFPEPTWESVVARQEHLRRWGDARLRLDSMRPLRENVADAIAYIDGIRASAVVSPRVVAVRSGRVEPRGSWLYVWIDVATGAIAYVGGTGFDPELRAHLHVWSEDPQLGRVRAAVPQYDERDFDVLAFPLPNGVDRPAAKQALVDRLAQDEPDPAPEDGQGDTTSGMRAVIDPIVQAIEVHRATLGRGSAAS